MLDAYIVDRIRREKEREQKSSYVPLHIEKQPPSPPRERREEREESDRGSVIIDFHM